MTAHRSVPFPGLDVLVRGTFLKKQISVPVSHEHMDGPVLEGGIAVYVPAPNPTDDPIPIVYEVEYFVISIRQHWATPVNMAIANLFRSQLSGLPSECFNFQDFPPPHQLPASGFQLLIFLF